MTIWTLRLWALPLIAASLTAGGSPPVAAAPGAQGTAGLTPAPVARRLNLEDPEERRLYQDVLRRAGVAQGNPLYGWGTTPTTGKKSKAKGAAPQQVFTLLGFGSDDAGRHVSSGALYATDADVYKITLTLVVTDADDNVVTRGLIDVTDRQSVVVNTPTGPNPEGGEINAVAVASVLYRDGTPEVFYVNGEAASYPTKVTQQAPARDAGGSTRNDVQICINRATAKDAPEPRCTAVLASAEQVPSLQLPVIGSAVFGGDIDVDAQGRPDKASASLVMVAPDGTPACHIAALGDAFFADPETKVAGDTLSWAFNPLHFEGCPIAAGPYSFSLALQVNVQGKPAWVSASSAIEHSTVTARAVPPVQVTAGCLAKGTAVALAKGGTLPVEEVKAGDTLAGESGGLVVAAVASGTRTQSLTLTLATGQRIEMSMIHPVATHRGIVQAQDLKLGDEVTTREGRSRVASILAQELPAPLQVYDLVLTPARGSKTQGSTFYAGGILVGDAALKAGLVNAGSPAQEQRP